MDAGVDFVVDDLTAITVLPAEEIRSKHHLKMVIKDIIGCAFKFDRIWLLVIEDDSPFDPSCISTFLLATNNFPCSLVVRYTTTESIFNLFNVIVCDAMTRAYAMNVTSFSYCNRSFLECLTNPRVGVHCKVLQMFPTINMFVAAQLLTKFQSVQNIMKENVETVHESLCLPNKERVMKFLSSLHDV